MHREDSVEWGEPNALLLFLIRVIDHPPNTELVHERPVKVAPEHLLQSHFYLPPGRELIEQTMRFHLTLGNDHNVHAVAEVHLLAHRFHDVTSSKHAIAQRKSDMRNSLSLVLRELVRAGHLLVPHYRGELATEHRPVEVEGFLGGTVEVQIGVDRFH